MLEDQTDIISTEVSKGTHKKSNNLQVIASALLGIIAGFAFLFVILVILNYFAIINLSRLFPTVTFLSYQNGKSQQALPNSESTNSLEGSFLSCSKIDHNPFVGSLPSITIPGTYTGIIEKLHLDKNQKIDKVNLKSLSNNQTFWFDISKARLNTYFIKANLKTSDDNLTVGQTIVIDFICANNSSAIAQLIRIGIQ